MLLGYFDIPKHWIRSIPSFSVCENETNARKCSSQTSYDKFINKMSEQQKRIATNKDNVKSNRGRKPGSVKSTWHKKLKEILGKNLKEKPRTIFMMSSLKVTMVIIPVICQ